MKILFLAPEPFFEVRGTPINVRQLLYFIGDMGHQVDLLTYHVGQNVSLKNVDIYRTINIPFIKHVPIGPSFVKIILDLFLFLKSISMLISRRYDLIHAVEESVFIAFLLKKVFKTPYIYDMDSWLSQQILDSGFIKSQFILRSVKLVEESAIRNSILTLTVCSLLTENVNLIAPGKKVFQIEDCPLSGFKKSSASEKLDKNKTIIMYIGNFEKYQGIELLLESISIVVKEKREINVILIGGEEEQIERMKSLAVKLGITEWVVFLGKRSPDEIPSLLEVADIVVSPRLKGVNTPFKIFDYLASGKPIVATDLPMHNQVLNDRVARLAEPDAQHFSEGILYLVNDRQARDEIGQQGRKLFESNYSASIFGEKVRKVYDFAAGSLR